MDWERWAARQPEQPCAGCERPFQPNHPRRRFCGRDDCPGPQQADPRDELPTRPRLRRVVRPTRATARTIGMQGVLADALIACHAHDPAGSLDELRTAINRWALSERDQRSELERRDALVAVIASATVRAQALTPADSIVEPIPDQE